MNKYYIILICILSSLATNISILFTFIKRENSKHILQICLSITIVLMISISVFELIPESIRYIKDTNNIIKFIISLMIIIFCNIVINKIDHNIEEESSLKRIGVLSAIAMFIHNVPEGIICATTSFKNYKIGLKICLLIMIHNIPEGLSISLPLYNSGESRLKSFIYTLFSSSGELFGVLLSILFYKYINNIIMYLLLITTAGIMLSVSINKIKPILNSYQNKKYNLIGYLIGIIISYIILK